MQHVVRCQERQPVAAQNARKTFGGRGSARDPAGELIAPQTLLPPLPQNPTPISALRVSPLLCAPSVPPHLVRAGDAPASGSATVPLHLHKCVARFVSDSWVSCGHLGYPNERVTTRSSADADKPRDAFRGQSRLSNIVPFHVLGIVSY